MKVKLKYKFTFNRNLIMIIIFTVFMISGINSFEKNDTIRYTKIPELISEEERGTLKIQDFTTINLISPESKGYSSPMNGYYTGPYGFESSIVGDQPAGWISVPPDGSGFIEVDAELDGHKNVVEMRKNGGTSRAFLEKRFIENVTAGTVEFWIYKDTDSAIDATKFAIFGEGGFVEIGIENMDLYRNPYGSKVTIGNNIAIINTWHHIRIDFDISQGGYQVYFNGVLYGSGYSYPFQNTPSEFYSFYVGTHWSGCNPNYGSWLDAVGFSWESSYQIAENLDEGLLLSFNTPTQLNWTCYSLNSAKNVTIIGNTTIPTPEIGNHTIQVFGNDSFNNWYRTPLTSFQYRFINILTPESDKDASSIRGYYPGTYSFDDQPQSTLGTDIVFVDEYYETVPGSADFVDVAIWEGPVLGHKSFIMVRDAQNSRTTWAVHHFDQPPVTGTIEFYLLVTGSAGTNYFELRATDDTPAVEMRISFSESKFQYFDGSSWQDISNLVIDHWLHHSITFDCEMGVNGQFSWIIKHENNTEVGRVENIEFQNDLNTLDEMYLGGTVSDYLIGTRWDAFGFSWDPKYIIGDNFQEGLLLNFNTPTILDSMVYSLDGLSNTTIQGNTTILAPETGNHTIQIFGNDSSGNWYKSSLISFQYRILDIFYPENKTYMTGINGYYPATYGFENDKIGEEPTGWEVYNDTNGFGIIESTLDGHNNIVHLRKNGGSTWSTIRKNFTEPVSSGIVEFWLYKDTDSGTDPTFFFIDSLLATEGHLQGHFENGNFYYSWGAYGDRVLVASNVFSINSWHHILIDFNISQGWQIRIDGTWYGTPYTFPYRNYVSGPMYRLGFASLFSGGNPNYGAWIDAIGYSWDPDYNVGENEEEGLLINFTSPTSLDWIGYSLDGGSNTTIIGNTTIPLPDPGLHTIQVFANDSSNNWYKSSLRSFQCGSSAPPSISGPNDFSFDFGEQGYSIIWSVSDPSPANFTVYKNGTLHKEGQWTTSVLVNLDGLEQGTHNFTCIVQNDFGSQALDEVWVTVLPSAPDTTPPTISSPADITFENGSIGYSIFWTGSDNQAPWWATIYKNQTLIYDQAWIGNDIEISLNGLIPGIYAYNCTLFDEAGNSVSDIVIVNVFPAVPDTEAPVIIPPAALVYEEGSTGNSLKWECSDAHPYAYKVVKDTSELIYAPWHGENITINVDGLAIGSYNYNLTLWDLSGNTLSSVVSVIVTPPVPDTNPPEISQPAEQIIAENTRGSIIWEVLDDHPSVCIISRNGTIVHSQSHWDSGILQYSFASLPLGTWQFTITLWDEAGNSASSEAIIRVLPGSQVDSSAPEISHHPDLEITFGSVNNFVVVYIFDEHPAEYTVYLDSLTMSESDWITPNIQVTIQLDGLAIGEYTLDIVASDTFGNNATRSIEVTVRGDITPPIFQTPPPDMTVNQGTSRKVVWQVSETAPSHYEIVNLTDGSVIQQGSWGGENVELSLNNLTLGTHYFRCIVYDASDNFAMDDVVITVRIKETGVPGFEFSSLSLLLIFMVLQQFSDKKRRLRK